MSIRLMSDVWEVSPYEGSQLLIHLSMADHANDEGWFFASQTRLSEKARCSTEYVRRTVRSMVEDGFLSIEEKGKWKGKATEYRLLNLPSLKLPNIVEEKPHSPTMVEQLPNYEPATPQPHQTTSIILNNNNSTSSLPTLNQRGNALAKHYADLQPMCNFPAIAGIVKKAIKAGFEDDEIRDALIRLATEGRSVTVETLRIELEGLNPVGASIRPKRESGTSTFLRLAEQLGRQELE